MQSIRYANPRIRFFGCCCCGLFLSFFVRIVSLPIFGYLDLVVYDMCEGFSTLMRVCLKLKIAWFHEIIHKFYIFRMQIWTDSHSVRSFHLVFSIWCSTNGISFLFHLWEFSLFSIYRSHHALGRRLLSMHKIVCH